MGYVPYVGFATYRRATVKIRLYFKRLMYMQMFCNEKRKEKKGRHRYTGLEARARALMLSHQTTRAVRRGMCSSQKSIWSQNNSIVTMARERYLASVLERDTTFCFLALHDKRDSPRNIANPEVERRSSGLPTQSELQNALSCWVDLE
jgi:hypothetical protein